MAAAYIWRPEKTYYMILKKKSPTFILLFAGVIFVMLVLGSCGNVSGIRISIVCSEDNDLFVTIKKNRIPCKQYDDLFEAVAEAKEGTGIMIPDNLMKHLQAF